MLIEEIKDIKSTKKDLRNFGLSVGIVLLIIAAVLYFLGASFKLTEHSYPLLKDYGVPEKTLNQLKSIEDKEPVGRLKFLGTLKKAIDDEQVVSEYKSVILKSAYDGHDTFLYFMYPGIALIVFGLIFPVVLKPLQIPWMIFAVILGWIMTRVILTLIFYLGIMPVRFAARIFGKNFLDKKWRDSSQTAWNYRQPKEFNKEDYEKQF